MKQHQVEVSRDQTVDHPAYSGGGVGVRIADTGEGTAGQPKSWVREQRKHQRLGLAGVTLLAALLLGIAAYTLISDGGSTDENPTVTTVFDREEFIRNLVNRGLVPAQALDWAKPSRENLMRDLINRGLIPSQSLDPASLELTAGPEDALASCLAFTPQELSRVAEIAFAGTVTAVSGAEVTLTVHKWYRGGGADEVVLTAPTGLEALIGGIPFQTGTQYLISAQDGTVNYCGFSGPASPENLAAFSQAFSQG